HKFVQTLKGQVLRIPDLDSLVRGWPKGYSPHYEAVKQVHNAVMSKLLGPSKRYKTLIACDCVYNACTWFPNASFDALCFASYVTSFLFVWDDELDIPDTSRLAKNWTAAEKYRADTIAHVHAFLDEHPPQDARTRSCRVETAIASFNPVGEAAAFRFNRGQKGLFCEEVLRYIRATGAEQRSELSKQAPTIDEYLETRMGTSGVAAVAATIEYMVGIDLGDQLRTDSDAVSIFNATNCLVSIMNDLFSLKKELESPFYNNAVAVLYHQHRDLQIAVNETYKLLARSVHDLETAAANLYRRFPDRRADLEKFVAGAQTMVTGNMEWSKKIPRYKLGGITKFDGTTEVTL
ncbi:terpenoid synthase, partial [Clavulina sp. PMI_390]